MFFRVTTVVTLVGGTLFLMWLGEQITSRGVGNGISLIIFSGIVAELPTALAGTLELGRTGALSCRADPWSVRNGGCGNRLHRFHRKIGPQDRRPISKAPAWQQGVWW
jgi:preprotein translocase subunit SecY